MHLLPVPLVKRRQRWFPLVVALCWRAPGHGGWLRGSLQDGVLEERVSSCCLVLPHGAERRH
jgi:hypothetical protein